MRNGGDGGSLARGNFGLIRTRIHDWIQAPLMNPTMIRASVFLSGIVLVAESAAHTPKLDKNLEKCGGIVKAGRNECGTSRHACAGEARTDGAQDEWIALPKGLCARIVGGKVLK